MAKPFKVQIVTPDKTAYEGEAVSATIPGLAGYLGVWANHAPLVAAVVPGGQSAGGGGGTSPWAVLGAAGSSIGMPFSSTMPPFSSGAPK